MVETSDRCGYELDPVAWGASNEFCAIDEDENILTETANGRAVWQCPHEAYETVDGETCCQFHLPTDADAKPDSGTVADEFVEIVNGNKQALDNDGLRPAQFIGAKFQPLTLDEDQIGDGREIDLRHAEIEAAGWSETTINAELLDAQGVCVEKKWDCRGSVFDGNVGFVAAEFGGDVRFDEAEFGGDVRFDEAEFSSSVWFKETEFSGRVLFDGVEFGWTTWFSRSEFRGRVVFNEAEFGRGADFGGAEFGAAVTFYWVKFDAGELINGVEFSRVEFSEFAGFYEAKFNGYVDFNGADFGGDMAFDRAKFDGDVNFDRAEFGGDVGFEEAKFDGYVDFSGAEFSGDMDFKHTRFVGGADFGGTEFGDRLFGPLAMFVGAEFGGDAVFSGSTFANSAVFREVEFSGSAEFSETDFYGADFSRSKFIDAAVFDGAEFFDSAVFKRVKFGGDIYFKRTRFGGSANFSGAGFSADAEFGGAKFRREARFFDVNFSGSVEFSRTEFGGNAAFAETTFDNGAVFTADGWYPVSPFQGDADFSDINADGPIRFIDKYDTESELPYMFLGTVDFSGADIPNTEFLDVSFFKPPIFDRTDLTGSDMSGLSLDQASFEDADLIRTDFSEASITEGNFNGAVLERAALYGTDLRNAKLYSARLADAHVSDHTDFGVREMPDSGQRASIIPLRSPLPAVRYDSRNPDSDQYDDNEDKRGGESISDHTRAASVYTEIQRVAQTNAASDLATRCFRWRKDMLRERYLSDEGRGNTADRSRWTLAWVSNLVARYGDSPWRVVYTSIGTITLFAVLYSLSGGVQLTADDGQNFAFSTAPAFSVPHWIETLAVNFYFSAVTFTTLGYGDIRPSSPVSQFLASAESFFGAALLALLVAVLARRLTR